MSDGEWFWWAELQLRDRSQVIRRLVALLDRVAPTSYCAVGALAAAGYGHPRFNQYVAFEVTAEVWQAVVTAARSAFELGEETENPVALQDSDSKVRVELTVGDSPLTGETRRVFGLPIRVSDPQRTMEHLLSKFGAAHGLPRMEAGVQIVSLASVRRELRHLVPDELHQWLNE